VERVKNVKRTQHEPETLETDFMDSQGGADKIAAQRSLRLDLSPADMASALLAQSGTSRTQAPSRPRRLHNISAEFVRAAVHGDLKDVKSS
jgi:hypothetical protein